MLLLLGSVLALGQSVASQSASVQSTSGQPVSSQPLSDQFASSQDSPSQPSSDQSSSGQSLGDVARANQQKKAEGAPPKKITNADVPKDPEGYAGPPADEDQNSEPSRADDAASRRAAQQRAAEGRAATQWRQRIVEQKNAIDNLQARIDELKASIHFVDPNRYYPYDTYSYYAGLGYNRAEALQLQRLHRMEEQLSEQKQKLEQMQEAARHAGMHTNVYDP